MGGAPPTLYWIYSVLIYSVLVDQVLLNVGTPNRHRGEGLPFTIP